MTATSDGLACGTGSAPAHHGEILQGVFRDGRGRLRRALVTLPYPERGSRATFYPDAASTEIFCPPGMNKTQRAAAISIDEFAGGHSPRVGGRIEVSSTVPRGIGMGSSTADVTAAIRAIAAYYGVTPSAQDVGRIAVRAECASDPIMVDDGVVLFAQRAGIVLETLGRRLPPLAVVGCVAVPDAGGIDTLALEPAAYSYADAETFAALLSVLRAAVAAGDTAGVGSVATASARISQRFLPNPALEFLLDVCRRGGGCGVQVAHSGTVAGIIFDPRQSDAEANVERCAARLEKAGLELTGVIRMRGRPAVVPAHLARCRMATVLPFDSCMEDIHDRDRARHHRADGGERPSLADWAGRALPARVGRGHRPRRASPGVRAGFGVRLHVVRRDRGIPWRARRTHLVLGCGEPREPHELHR